MNGTQAQELNAAERWTMAVDFKVVSAFAIIYLVWGTTFLAIRYTVESIPQKSRRG